MVDSVSHRSTLQKKKKKTKKPTFKLVHLKKTYTKN